MFCSYKKNAYIFSTRALTERLLVARTCPFSFRQSCEHHFDREQSQQLFSFDITTVVSEDSDCQSLSSYFDDINCQSFSDIKKKSITKFESRMANVSPTACKECLRCSLSLNVNSNNICNYCLKSKINPIYNNQLPVWYDNGVPQFHIPVQLSCLRLAEKMLLQLVSPFVPQQYINNGTFGLKGHVCCFPQDIGEVAKVLPRLPSDVKMIKLVRQVTTAVGGPRTNKSFSVRRKETLEALLWLKDHNVLYKDVTIDCSQLNWMQSEDEADISPHIQEIVDKESKSVSDDSDVSDNKSVSIDEVNNKRDLFYDVEEVECPSPFLNVLDDLGPAPGQVMAPREANREE